MDKINKVVPLDDYRLDIITSSGVSGIFDMKPYMCGAAFRELDGSVCAAYGWSPESSDAQILEALLSLNSERASR